MNNLAGIDVSKGKSMVSVLRPFGEVVALPFTVQHTPSELRELANYLKSLEGETRVVMEHTGRYYEPIAQALHDAGIYVCAVNPKLIKDYGNNSLRKVKTDKADSRKIARYGLDNWADLRPYSSMDTIHGIPELREFPLLDAAHVRAAEAYFRYAPEEYKAQLARNILVKAHLFGVNVKSPTILEWAEK